MPALRITVIIKCYVFVCTIRKAQTSFSLSPQDCDRISLGKTRMDGEGSLKYNHHDSVIVSGMGSDTCTLCGPPPLPPPPTFFSLLLLPTKASQLQQSIHGRLVTGKVKVHEKMSSLFLLISKLRHIYEQSYSLIMISGGLVGVTVRR